LSLAYLEFRKEKPRLRGLGDRSLPVVQPQYGVWGTSPAEAVAYFVPSDIRKIAKYA